MQNLPLVTVICISYNHESFIEEALNSVLNQTYPNVELIITDDGSSDDSQKVIKNWLLKHPAIRFIPNFENIGNTKTFNNAVQFAQGDYIIDLAADDILLEHCIMSQVSTFLHSTFKNLGIVYGNIIQFDENGDYPNPYYTDKDKPESGNIYPMVISERVKICSVGSMVKKEVFETVGFYDESLAYEDLDLWIRASRVFDFEYIPEILVKKRELTNSISAQFQLKHNKRSKIFQHSTLQMLEKAFRLNTNKTEHKLLLNRIKNELIKAIYIRNFYIFPKLILLYSKTLLSSF